MSIVQFEYELVLTVARRVRRTSKGYNSYGSYSASVLSPVGPVLSPLYLYFFRYLVKVQLHS
jgi:hypothetical protein